MSACASALACRSTSPTDASSLSALAIAGLTTTGPALSVLGDGEAYLELTLAGRAIFCAAMIVGRMEVLVIVALFNPVYWRQ